MLKRFRFRLFQLIRTQQSNLNRPIPGYS